MTSENETQNTDAADSPYVAEKPTLWSRLTKPRKAALITGAAIAAGTSIFAVNLALADPESHQTPRFGNGGHHKFPGLTPTDAPDPGAQPQGGAGTDPAGVPPIHGVPPMAIHPGDDTPTALPLPPGEEDGDDDGMRPPRGPGEGDHHGHHGDDHNESTEGSDE